VFPGVDEGLVDLIGEDKEVVALRHICDAPGLFSGQHAAGGVAG